MKSMRWPSDRVVTIRVRQELLPLVYFAILAADPRDTIVIINYLIENARDQEVYLPYPHLPEFPNAEWMEATTLKAARTFT